MAELKVKAGPNSDRECQIAFKEVRDIADKDSKAKQLREVAVFLDPSNSEAVKTFYDHMPEAVKEYNEWKRGAAKLIVTSSEIGSMLTLAFTGGYADEEVFDDFTSESFTNEITQLNSEIAHDKVINGMKLAQDAARDFAWWEQFNKDISNAGTAAVTTLYSGLSGCAYAVASQGLRTAAVSLGPVAVVSVVALQLWFGWMRVARNEKGKKNLTHKAIDVSDITESIQRDVRMLDEVSVHIDNIAKCQRKVRNFKRIGQLQKDKIVRSAKKLVDACDRYNELLQ